MKKNKSSIYAVLMILMSVSAHAADAKKTSAADTTATTAASPAKSASTTTAAAISSSKPMAIQNGSIEFFAIGKPSMLKIHGQSTKMSGTMNRDGNKLSGVLDIPLDSFETGMSVRNSHLKEKVFETSKYSKATLTISSLLLPEGKTGELKDLPFTGKLSLHGVEKDISGTATVNAGDKLVSFTADFQMNMSDYSIPPPEFMGMSMKDDVKVSAKGDAKSAN